jgi:ubiquinone/menaquinone biosynthesis C-methylase UbiE
MAEMAEISNDEQITAHDYDRWLMQDSFMARWMRFWLSPSRILLFNTPVHRLPKQLSLKPTDKVLDIGCGYAGLLLYLLRKVGFTEVMEGLDCSAFMVEQANAEVQARGADRCIRVRQGLATQLPYADGAFDEVFCTYVIKHLSDALLHEMLRETMRVLKPGGRLCVWEAGPARRNFMQVSNLWLLRHGVSVVHLRSDEELRGILLQSGFNSIEPCGRGPYFYYPPLPRVGFIAARPVA